MIEQKANSAMVFCCNCVHCDQKIAQLPTNKELFSRSSRYDSAYRWMITTTNNDEDWECTASEISINFVTGKVVYANCCDINTSGKCVMYKAK